MNEPSEDRSEVRTADRPATGALLLQIHALRKQYRKGFWGRRVDAVRGLDLEVRQGEVFGLLGPNGAGKTTTLKCVLGLVAPTQGEVMLFGRPCGDPRARTQLGYLPEHPYIYPYLTPLEFLDLCGRLNAMPRATRHARSLQLLKRLQLGHVMERPIGKFSKGMLQRVGLAQALLHDPDLLILDEPMSGLDPTGRKEVRDLIIEQREAGKTLIFTSHILTDVERLCDRVAFMRAGQIVREGRMEQLLRSDGFQTQVQLSMVSEVALPALEALGRSTRRLEDRLELEVGSDEQLQALLAEAQRRGAHIDAVQPLRATLESLFVETSQTPTDAKDPPAGASAEP